MTLSIPLLIEEVLRKSRSAGADETDVLVRDQRSISCSQRLGTLEKLSRSQEVEIGIRVFKGKKQALVSGCVTSEGDISVLIERALSMASYVPEDPYCGLEKAGDLFFEELDLWEEEEPTVEKLQEMTARCESKSLSLPGITNSGGATAQWTFCHTYLGHSQGFLGDYKKTIYTLSMEAIAGKQSGMEAYNAFAYAIFSADLEDPEEIGHRAAVGALKALKPRKIRSTVCPVVYSPLVSHSLLSHFCAAINGESLIRGVSFLKDHMGKTIFPAGVTIRDNPFRKRGLRSHPFDTEGVKGTPLSLVENGVLKSWILNHRTGRYLSLPTTGHGFRNTNSIPTPTPTNVFLEPGTESPESLIGSLSKGLLVTDLMGASINPTTGDYSRGAKGFWIENGQIAYPVHEITLSGNLLEMFKKIQPANDLSFKYGFDAPTLLIDGMCVAGK